MALEPSTVKIFCRFDRLSVHTPYEGDLNKGNPKFKVTCIIDPADPRGKASIAEINRAVEYVGKKAFNSWPVTWKDPKRYCVSDGNTHTFTDKTTGDEVQKPAYKGMKIVTASSKNRPVCKKADGKTPLVATDNAPVSGDYGWVVVNFYATTDPKQGGRGLFAGFEGIQMVREGEPLGRGSRITDDVFSDESDDAGEEDAA